MLPRPPRLRATLAKNPVPRAALLARTETMMNRQEVFRRLLKTRLFTRFYGSVVGPASAKMFCEPLRTELLDRLGTGARVLEVGCGPGLQAIQMALQRPDLHITASDFSAAFVRLGESNAEVARLARGPTTPPLQITFSVADAMDLSCFESRSFDGVYSMTAIKHFPDPVLGLRECLRVLKPGAPLVVTEICRESDLAEVQTLANLFELPDLLRSLAARVVHSSLREECPPLVDVKGWLTQLGKSSEPPVLSRIPGNPAWLMTLVA